MRKLGRPRLVLLVCVLALLSPACVSGSASSSNGDQSSGVTMGDIGTGDEAIANLRKRLQGQSLTVGTSASQNPALTGAVHTVRTVESMFGVKINLRQLDSDPLVAAVISGSVEVGQLSLAGTAAGRARGAGFLAFAGDDQKNPYYVIGRAPLDNLADVRGKPFGASSNLTQITGQTATACLASVGIDIRKDVDLVQLANTGAVADALRTGQVVAGLTAPHRMAPIIAKEGPDAYNVLCYGYKVSPQLNNVWMAKEDWVEQHQDMALAFAIASIDTGRWSHANRDEWLDLATEVAPDYERAAAATIYQAYVEDLDSWPVNGSLNRDLCDKTLESSLDSGALEKPMSCDDVVNFDFQEQALEILGKQ